MAVSGMRKLSLYALSEDADALITRLMWLSCVELVKAEDGAQTFSVCGDGQTAHAQARFDRINDAIAAVKPDETVKKGLFVPRPVISGDAFRDSDAFLSRAQDKARQILQMKDDLLRVSAEQNRCRNEIASLSPWSSFDLPLNYKGTRDSRVLLGYFPVTANIDGAFKAVYEITERAEFEKVSDDDTAQYYCVVCYTADYEAVDRILGSFGFVRSEFPEYAGTAYEEIQALQRSDTQHARKTEELEQSLREAAQDIDFLKQAADVAATELVKERSKEKLLHSATSVYVTGWVPEQASDRVTKLLDKYCCAYELSVPDESDDPPVLLKNNKWARPFEYVVSLYSLPAYGTFDPTFIMSIFYFIIFGMMLADVIYGLILFAGGLLVWKLLDTGPGVKSLAQMFCFCGISCALFGILFGGYCGDLPVKIMQNMFGDDSITSVAALFDPTTGNGPIYFLIISLGAGAIHLLFGMGIEAYLLIKDGKALAALFDVGSWYVLFAGIALLFLNAHIGAAVIVVGALMLIVSQGREAKNPVMRILKGITSLYGIVNYMADLLSYSRIMALGLASAIIASVVNTLATLPGNGVLGWIIMTVIVLFGHTLNLAINLLGTFVHTSRLQYIEFFGKFYTDGGRQFDPVSPEITYTRLENETLITEEK